MLVLGLAILSIRQPDSSGRFLIAVDGASVAVGTLAVCWQANIGPSLSSMSASLVADKVT
jgi:hypothetical protein